jgi:hypothetical protein
LAQKGVSEGIPIYMSCFNEVEICNILKGLPGHLTLESLDAALAIVRAETLKSDASKSLINWLKHKDSNPWVLQCLCFPLSSMKATDWIATSFTSNIAESAHALSQRHGKHLTLVGAIQVAEKIDGYRFNLAQTVQKSGVKAMYGNGTTTGRVRKNLTRQTRKSHAEATKKAKKHETTEKILMEAKHLLDAGISKEVVEEFLASKSKS